MTIEKLRPAFTFTKDRLHQLQQIVPEAFADGKINWEALRQALGEHLEDDAQEHFGLTWPGKREARRLAALPPQGDACPRPWRGRGRRGHPQPVHRRREPRGAEAAPEELRRPRQADLH